MLHDDDIRVFLKIFEESNLLTMKGRAPDQSLGAETGLFAAEVWRLAYSLRIAMIVGDAPPEAVVALEVIVSELRKTNCVPLADTASWSEAIAWALAQPAYEEGLNEIDPIGRDRQRIVGEACLRLRRRGYNIEIGAYGPQIAQKSQQEIVLKCESLIGLLGGLEMAGLLIGYLINNKRHHDGIWLFGETGLETFAVKQAMLPVGWLFALALKHVGRPRTARKPEVAWETLIQLATDFAAAQDCQRYNQFDTTNPHPSQFPRILAESLMWRELFTLPQVPAGAVRRIFRAIASNLISDDELALGFPFAALVREVEALIDLADDQGLKVLPRTGAETRFPILHRSTGALIQRVNTDYNGVLAAKERTQEKALMIECGRDRVLLLPRAFLCQALCELGFNFIRSKLEPERGKLVLKNTMEGVIAEACDGKADTVLTNREYLVGKGQRYEFDVATRSGNEVVLIETKGKSLTRTSRTGDMMSVFGDYTDSFLTLLNQLVRHEVNLKEGRTPLATANEDMDALRVFKIAVSPLSYGPVSDKFLSGALINSLIGTKFNLVTPDKRHQAVLNKANDLLERIVSEILPIAPTRKVDRDASGEIIEAKHLPDLFGYLFDVFWLDLGQLLYVLDRARTVADAFLPLSRITFSSRDFWLELANVDRMSMTKDRWRPVVPL